MDLRFTHNGPDLVASIERRTRAVPSMLADALRRTGLDVRDDLREAMRRNLDQPTPFTINSLRIISDATRERPAVEIGFRDFAPKGTPAGKYLRPQIEGGPRRQKRSERALSIRANGRQVYMVPTRNAPLDAYGNVRPGYIVRVLSALQAFSESGFRANRTERTRRRDLRRGRDFFAIWPGSNQPGLPPGIYERRITGFGRGVIPIFLLTDQAPVYRKSFDFWAEARASVARRLPPRLAAIGQGR